MFPEASKTGLFTSRDISKPEKRYTGEVVYIFAYDLAYEIPNIPVDQVLNLPVQQFEIDSSKRYPKQALVHRPKMIRLPDVEKEGPFGKILVRRAVKMLNVGAISVSVRVPFSVHKLEDLVSFHDLHFSGHSLHDEIRELAERVSEELKPFAVRPHRKLAEEEAYTVFCLNAPIISNDSMSTNAEKWLHANRRQVAALLTQEADIAHLSQQEAEESTQRYLSYYEKDIVVIDWDAALIIDDPANFDETLFIMELANLQLAELEAYDRILDEALERAYRDLERRSFAGRNAILRELRELRIDLARFGDELSNITKFFGDWHLARIYKHLAARFHLAGWHRNTDEKLKTLDNLYQLLTHDHSNRLMLILELTIVLLFIIDLIMLFTGG